MGDHGKTVGRRQYPSSYPALRDALTKQETTHPDACDSQFFVRPFIALVNTEALKKSSLVSKSSLSQVIFILLFLSQQCPSFFYLNFRNRLLTIITSNLTHTCPKNNKHTKTSTKKYLHCKSCKINNLLASERLPCRSCRVLKALDEGSQD